MPVDSGTRRGRVVGLVFFLLLAPTVTSAQLADSGSVNRHSLALGLGFGTTEAGPRGQSADGDLSVVGLTIAHRDAQVRGLAVGFDFELGLDANMFSSIRHDFAGVFGGVELDATPWLSAELVGETGGHLISGVPGGLTALPYLGGRACLLLRFGERLKLVFGLGLTLRYDLTRHDVPVGEVGGGVSHWATVKLGIVI